jgi:hypothetical protein
MGFLDNTTTIELKAKLTPEGRKKLITGSNTLITQFAIGDSDAYYGAFSGLTGGQVPVISGDNSGSDEENGGLNYSLKSIVQYQPLSEKKPVNSTSPNVNINLNSIGYNTTSFSGGTVTQFKVNLNDYLTDTLTNLFYSFSLPITSSQFTTFTATTDSSGGYSDTAYSGLSQKNILVINIDKDEYGEIIDGKTIKLDLTTTASTYSIYGTFESNNESLTSSDSRKYETSSNIETFGPNRTLLFTDGVKKPGNNPSKSWATGYGTNKPFSVNNKQLYNYKNTTTLTADTAIGVAYLDKGFLVITDPTIVNDFDVSNTATTVTFESYRNKVSQSVTCMVDRGEFTTSTNPTFGDGDTIRITEIGLYDIDNTLIAIGKLNKTYYKTPNDFVVFDVTINY